MSNTHSSIPEDALALIDALFEGRLEGSDAKRLERMVVNDPAVAHTYLRFMHMQCSLQLHIAPKESGPLLESLVQEADDTHAIAAVAARPRQFASRTANEPRRINSKIYRSAAAVAFLLIGLAIYFGMRTKSETTPILAIDVKPSGIIGHITKAVDCQWKEKHMFTAVGTPLGVGQLDLLSGTVELTMGSDVRVVLTGPVRADLRSAGDVFLHQGKISAEVGVGGIGFTVNTKSAHVVDLGTEFSVLVSPAGVTETHVLRGRVQLQPTAAGAPLKNMVAGEAFAVSAGSASVEAVAFQPTLFKSTPTALDLVDIVAGGDGTQGRRNAGIDAADGSQQSGQLLNSQRLFTGDGRFHPCPGQPFVAGVFIPKGGSNPVVLDPAGHSFVLPPTDNTTWFWLWAGGSLPYQDRNNFSLGTIPSVMRDVDYSTPGHGVLFMHASKGITFDLAALRAAHPDRPFKRLQAVCTKSTSGERVGGPVRQEAALWVFVDGGLQFKKLSMLKTDVPFDVTVDIPARAKYLTIVATDGGDGNYKDYLLLGDPRLE